MVAFSAYKYIDQLAHADGARAIVVELGEELGHLLSRERVFAIHNLGEARLQSSSF